MNISQHGFWLNVRSVEYFLPFRDYPWFRNANVASILKVKLDGAGHLRWEDLDVDLSLEILERSESFPLIAKS